MSRRLIGLVAIIAMFLLMTLIVDLPTSQAAVSISGLHVVGNQIRNAYNQIVHLYGVNRSGAEYACEQGWGIFDGPVDQPSVSAIASWHVNIVRIPVNEDCWLAINGIKPLYAGSNYQSAIITYVNLLNSNGMAAIIDLQFAAPGTTLAATTNPMPDRDHAPTFWQSVATTFKSNGSVIFDLFNEPYPDNQNDSTAAWTCWKNGGSCPGVAINGVPYTAAGMQELVNAVRGTGATNIIMAGGVNYSNILTQWLTYKPSDPTGNLVASWHIYDFAPACNTTPYSTCWDSVEAPLMTQVPLITGEIGESDCAHGFIDPLMSWLDAHGGNYLGWAWDSTNSGWGCGSGPALIVDYNGTPTNFGVGLKNHLASLPPQVPFILTPRYPICATQIRCMGDSGTNSGGLKPMPTHTPTRAPTQRVTTTVDDQVRGTSLNQFNYAGQNWSHCANCNEASPAIFYNASQSWDQTQNDSVTIQFEGTKIVYYAVTGPAQGIAAVSIDGGAETHIDLYSSVRAGNVAVWTSLILTYGKHTLKIRVTGTRNPLSSGTVIAVDRVDVTT